MSGETGINAYSDDVMFRVGAFGSVDIFVRPILCELGAKCRISVLIKPMGRIRKMKKALTLIIGAALSIAALTGCGDKLTATAPEVAPPTVQNEQQDSDWDWTIVNISRHKKELKEKEHLLLFIRRKNIRRRYRYTE